MPRDLDVHLIVDNYSTHKHDKVKKNGWHGDLDFTFITRPPMLHGSIRWRFGATSLPVRRSGATRFAKLKSGSNAKWNANAHPFMWTATADSILAKGKRLCEYISAT